MLVPYKPTFYIQYVPGVYGLLASGNPVFGEENVDHYLHHNMVWPGLIDPFVQFAPNATMDQVADAAVSGLLTLKNALANNFPNKEFRYGFGPAGFQNKFPHDNPTDNSLFNHVGDRITISGKLMNSIFHPSGIAAVSGRMVEFFSAFKSKLDLHNLPYPIFIDPDAEGDDWHFTNATGTNPTDWVTAKLNILSHPLAHTYLIDGVTTFANYCANAQDMSRNLIPSGQLFPFIYQAGNENTIHSFLSIYGRVLMYDMNKSLYEIAKVYFPNVRSGNYNYFAATREHQTWAFRPKELGVDGWDYVAFDWQVPSMYGPPLHDVVYNNTTGLANYANCLAIWGVSSGATHEITLNNMWSGFTEFTIRNTSLAHPASEVVPWLDVQPVIYQSGLMDQYPHTYYNSVDNLKHVMRIGAQYGVQNYGVFNIAPNGSGVENTLYNLINSMSDILVDDGNPSNSAISYRAATVARFGGGFFKY